MSTWWVEKAPVNHWKNEPSYTSITDTRLWKRAPTLAINKDIDNRELWTCGLRVEAGMSTCDLISEMHRELPEIVLDECTWAQIMSAQMRDEYLSETMGRYAYAVTRCLCLYTEQGLKQALSVRRTARDIGVSPYVTFKECAPIMFLRPGSDVLWSGIDYAESPLRGIWLVRHPGSSDPVLYSGMVRHPFTKALERSTKSQATWILYFQKILLTWFTFFFSPDPNISDKLFGDSMNKKDRRFWAARRKIVQRDKRHVLCSQVISATFSKEGHQEWNHWILGGPSENQ